MRVLFVLALLAAATCHIAYGFTHEIMSMMLGLEQINWSPGQNPIAPKGKSGGDNGGAACAGCTLAVSLLSQTMQHKKLPASQALASLCGSLPSPLDSVCSLIGPILGPILFPLLESKQGPDAVCNALGICKAETEVCRLFSAPKHDRGLAFDAGVEDDKSFLERVQKLKSGAGPGMSEEMLATAFGSLRQLSLCNVMPGLCQGKDKDYKPAVDKDKDSFSTIALFRGSDWRGKDCNDLNKDVYPGRRVSGELLFDEKEDTDCNGIYGVDSASGKTYEELLCARSEGVFGVATLGDSASAHFRIPDQMFDVTQQSKEVFAGLIDLVANSADFPQLSWATGHQNTTKYDPIISGPMTSVYSKLKELNACNHRDYQNIGVNGASSIDLPNWVDVLTRDSALDKPIITFFSMVGNDVCTRTKNFDAMTKPEDYYAYVLEAVQKADAKLPKGSHVVLVPLVDGRVLYNAMHDQLHPLGRLNKDLTFEKFYDYLNCLGMSPCWGWMNSDASVRTKTFEITSALNSQLPRIAAETQSTLRNIKVHYAGPLLDEVVASYARGPKSDLIEPVDGFHPSQLANALLGNLTFHKLQSLGIVPKTPNPYNAAILRLFGDQGGY